jgi:hypothetical protein
LLRKTGEARFHELVILRILINLPFDYWIAFFNLSSKPTNMFLLEVVPKEFFTLQSMLTLTGASGIVFIVSNGIQSATGKNPKWLGLAIALIVCLAGVFFSDGKGSDYFVGVINGFLVYSTAAGGTHILANKENMGAGPAKDIAPDTIIPATPKRKFLSPWW